MKNKILLSSILLIVLMLGLSTITATDTTTTTSIEKQTIDTTTSQTIDNKEKVIVNDNKEVKSNIKDTKTEITPKKEIKTKEITTQKQKNKEEIKTTNKTLKKESEINYYVSNDKGSDTNDGSIDKPYKTINQAITQTTKDNIYNIHISTGTYTGVGNTNLTVNGDYKINFIGDGINKTIIDGEVNYTIGGASVWGDDSYFNSYIITKGNWGMNITKGTGIITIKNMNIQHMLSNGTGGGSSISLYPTATVDNYGNLEVDNVYFFENLAGVGAGIRSNNGSTLLVNNSIFEGNRKGSSTGNYGAGIYNNGTAIVLNSQFIGNIARWGTITNDKIIDIINCTIKDGKAYNAASTFKFGSGIASNTGGSDYFNPYGISGLVTNVINSTFINNQQTDIYQREGNLYVDNCIFNKSTGIYVTGKDNATLKNEIYNSSFNDMQPSSLFGSLSVTTGTTFAIYSTVNRNTTIKSNIINFTSNGYGMYLKGNTTVTNNTITKYIAITGDNNNITNNIIKTNDIYSITLNRNSKNNTIINNTIYSQVFTGDKAISSNNNNNIIKDNIPETGIYINLTNNNYNTYFDDKGIIRTDVVENGSIITITGNITNKDLTFSNIKVFLSSKKNVYIQNGSISIINNASLIIQNTSIKNNNKYGLLIDSENNLIKNNNIIINTTIPIEAIIIKKDNNNLEKNVINITSTTNNTGISIESSYNYLLSNKINTTTISKITDTTIIGLNLKSNTNNNILSGNRILMMSNINAIGEKLIKSDNNIINDNIYVYASENAKGVELINSQNNQINNYINIISNNTGYGTIITGEKALNKNNTISNNIDITADTIIGTLLENTTNTNISSRSTSMNYVTRGNTVRTILTKNTNNTEIFYLRIYITKEISDKMPDLIGIEQINSENTNITAITMQKNILSGSYVNYNSTFLKLVNTTNTYLGSRNNVSSANINIVNIAIILENSDNNIIDNITINTNTDYTINLTNSNNNTIINNYLNGNNFYGGDSAVIQTNSQNNIIQNNTPNVIILTNDNYNQYFINQTWIINKTVELILGSDIYNKNMTFNNAITLKNPRKYTIYNGTITINSTETSNLNILKLNITDDRKTVINVMAGTLNINNANITQINNENQAQTIYVNTNSKVNIVNINITLNAPEINSEDNTKVSTAAYSEGSLTIHRGNITVNTTKTVQNGKIIAMINIGSIYLSNITMNSENNAIAFIKNIFNDTAVSNIGSNNFNLYSKNQTIGIISENHTFLRDNNITLNSPYTTGIIQTNGYLILENNKIITNGTNNTPFYLKNYISSFIETRINENIFISNNNTQNIIENRSVVNITNNIIKVENQSKTHLIIIENSNNIRIIGNYLETSDLKGNNAVKVINSTNITMSFNRPGVLITNENYNQYFTNQTLNSDITIIEFGSDLINKSMIFNHPVIIENPNNYTVYNGTIIFTENATNSNMTGINIHNTDDRQTSLEIYSKSTVITNNNIYQENTNNPAKTIIVNNTGSVGFSRNNITTIGKNVTIITLNNLKIITSVSNIINGKGSNITAIEVTNSKTATIIQITTNNITLESENPITAVRFINSKGVRLTNNIVIVKTKNYDTPIIEIINPTINVITNNYIESEDVCGNDAVKKIGTGTASINNNKPTNGNYRTQMNITTLPSELKVGKTYPITINVTSMLDKPVNGTIILHIEDKETNLTLTDGIATYNYTPTKDGENTIKITYQDPNGKYENNTITQSITVNKINAILKVDSVKGIPNTRINIPITLTDEFENPLNGTVTVIDQYNNTFAIINVIDGKGTFTKIFRGNFNQNLTFIYEETEIYNAINTTINVDIHKLSTTVIIDPINAQIGDKINLKATVTDEDGNPVTEGRLVFKVNGKTIKDANGNIIYATITNGIAMIENYTVPANWFKIKSEISVLYGGTNKYTSYRSEAIPMNITKKTATMTMTTNTTTAKPGETIKITVKITEKDANVNEGRVLFKVNGKTMRDNEGYIIYHEVKDGLVTITYTIPENARAQDYTFTCVYGNKLYNRNDVNSTITVVKN